MTKKLDAIVGSGFSELPPQSLRSRFKGSLKGNEMMREANRLGTQRVISFIEGLPESERNDIPFLVQKLNEENITSPAGKSWDGRLLGIFLRKNTQKS